MRTLFVILTLLSSVAFAQDTPKTMTRLEVRMAGREVPPGSFAAKPKVYFRTGNRYCRIEEAEDTENKIHGLMILNEPDAWMVNLFDKTARHTIDRGPTFNCRLPIFLNIGADDAPDLATQNLEFGKELEFFRSYGASPHTGPVVENKQTSLYIIEMGTTNLGLLTYGSPERPLTISRKYKDHMDIFWYNSSEEIPFDPKLFSKPEGVTIQESNH